MSSEQARGGNITVGNITESKGIAIGANAHAAVTEGASGPDIAALFASVRKAVTERPTDPDVDKEEVARTVADIEQETGKGEAANPTKLRRWLKLLGDVAPDVLDATVKVLTGPAVGVAQAVTNVARRVADEFRNP